MSNKDTKDTKELPENSKDISKLSDKELSQALAEQIMAKEVSNLISEHRKLLIHRTQEKLMALVEKSQTVEK